MSIILFKQEVDKQVNKPNKKRRKKKYIYTANKRSILSAVKQYFYKIYLSKISIVEILSEILKKLITQAVPIRHGRKYPRAETFKAKKKISRTYLPVT